MIWKFLSVFLFVVVLFLAVSQRVNASQDCPTSYTASTHEIVMTSQARHGQQYTHNLPADLVSVTMNVNGNVASSGNLRFQIHQTTAGLPNSSIVAGSIVDLPASAVPDRPVGAGQKFSCNSLPPGTTFTFAAPITLTPGTMYAFVVYNSNFDDARIGIFAGNFPGIAPGQGVTCTGSPCITHSGWALNTHSGFNYDNVYSIENEFVETGEGTGQDIDAKIFRFREWAKLTGDAGGIVFAVTVIGLMFIVGLGFKVPFILVGMTATMIVAALARAKIVEPWIVIAVVAVAGLAMVFKIGSGMGGSEDEG